jgi:curved DNA-binding protein CbpA
MSEGGEKDYYEILGAPSDATRAEIGRRYKRLAAERHPDRGGSDAEMRELNEAYRVLGDAATRESYDAARRSQDGARAARGDAPARDGEETAYVAAREFVPAVSPAAQADAVGGRIAGALLCLFAGTVLLCLVRFHYVLFLWPLALLAVALLLFGVWMAHAALGFARGGFAPGHLARRTRWAQEALFWAAFAGGGYALYLLLAEW